MAEDLLRSTWSQRPTPLAFGASVKRLITSNECTPRDFCSSLLRQVCVGATPSPLLLSYLRHCLSLSILKTLHFLDLLPSQVSPASKPLQLGALLDVVDQFVLYLKPTGGLKDYYVSLIEPEAADPAKQRMDEESLEVVRVLAQTCTFLAQIATEGTKDTPRVSPLWGQILENAATALSILHKVVLLDLRTSSLLAVACHHFPDFILSLEDPLQNLVTEQALPAQSQKDLRAVVDQLQRIKARTGAGRGQMAAGQGGLLAAQTRSTSFPSSLPSPLLFLLLHQQMLRRIDPASSDANIAARLDGIILAKGLSLETSIFEIYLAALIGMAEDVKEQPQEMNEKTPAKQWELVVLAKIPQWIGILLSKQSAKPDDIDFGRITASLSSFTSLVAFCSPPGRNIVVEVAKTWIEGRWTTKQAMQALLGSPSPAVDASSLQAVLKMGTASLLVTKEPQFRSAVETLTLSFTSLPAHAKSVAALLTDLLQQSSSSQGHLDKFALVCYALLNHSELLDALNLFHALPNVLAVLERFCNHCKADKHMLAPFAVAFPLFLLVADRFYITPRHSGLYAEPEGFCARWVASSPASAEPGKETPANEDLSPFLTSLFRHSPPSLPQDRLQGAFPHKLVAMTPLLALQGCLACESHLLAYPSLVGGLLFLSSNPSTSHTTPGIVAALCEELAFHLSSWKVQVWGHHNTALPLPLAIISDLLLSDTVSLSILRIVSRRVSITLAAGGLEALVPSLVALLGLHLSEQGAGKEFDLEMRKSFSAVARLVTPIAPSPSDRSGVPSSLKRKPMQSIVRAFGTALHFGGPRYFAALLVELLLTEANQGEGLRAAELATALATTPLGGVYPPELVLTALFCRVLPEVIPQVRTSSEGTALAHFVLTSLLLCPSSSASPGGALSGAIEEFMLLLSEIVEDVTRLPGPLLVFVTSFFSHPAISSCPLSLHSHTRFAALLKGLRREDLLLNMFDLRMRGEQLACARLFAFPLRTDALEGPATSSPE